MKIIIQPKKIHGTIQAVPSKSHAHRALICAALCEKGDDTVINISSCGEDIDATISVLKALGVCRITENGSVTVHPTGACVNGNEVNCRESGSTLRFMLPVIAALGAKVNVNGYGRLPYRPIGELLGQLRAHGGEFSAEKLPLDTSGKLEGGDYYFDGNISSQYITGVLLAAPLTGQECRIHINGRLQSKPYVDLTVKVMRDFGINVQFEENVFTVQKGTYRSPRSYAVEGDWSNAAFWLCMGVGVSGLQAQSFQGDCAMIDILRSAGADVKCESGVIYPHFSRLNGFTMNAENTPDIVPPLAVAAATANGTTVITGAERLKIKESDRLKSVYDMLCALGADCELKDDGFVIHGKKMLKGGVVDACNDHRIAMSAAVASAHCESAVTVIGAEAVSKSYRDFWVDLEKLGGATDEIR